MDHGSSSTQADGGPDHRTQDPQAHSGYPDVYTQYTQSIPPALPLQVECLSGLVTNRSSYGNCDPLLGPLPQHPDNFTRDVTKCIYNISAPLTKAVSRVHLSQYDGHVTHRVFLLDNGNHR